MSILTPGDTCWRRESAGRAAFLVDTEAYFNALAEILPKAQKSIYLLGWGFDPRTRLAPDGFDGPDDPDEIGRILVELSRRRPELDIRLLIWKSALPISASQNFFPHRGRRWFHDTTVQLRLDESVPLGACHHQKVLVVDDAVAICGGGDISVDRWDTAAHLDDDQRRIMPDQECHDPRHEVMLMVDGAAASALGDLFRTRWRRSADEVVPKAAPSTADPWPTRVPAHMLDVDVGIARTEPAWKRDQMVEEIRRLTLASIFEAKDLIYLENQYFTSPIYAEALAARLTEPNGPEVVMISTGYSPSWFDRLTMDQARNNMLWRLQVADIFGRFHAYWPVTRSGQEIIVHSKVTVIDDRLARVGSANLNNRSGGFDTECELAIEANGEDDRMAIGALRDRLVGHFMGYTGDAVTKARLERGGLGAAISALNHEGRLRPLGPRDMTTLGKMIAAFHIGDPADVADSWRIFRRRDRLYEASRRLSQTIAQGRPTTAQASSKSITSGR
ncbi:phospholipase D-like domain-containing protein [Phenylobacterium sp.]|uniref:phospholipase D-like domain-containing protein n=1 Tax=Phenylobacterium sp. TaxID=1871053 RepID=UPI00272F4A52|nr:phospholipase D-like domain-containing protein [Phenylobacterium sp.]MDP2215657.1 phospholipase D-like domain-containing protein [Phenylobacterium sp.]